MVLAAGNGIRMRPLTERMPKPLIAVGGKPLLDNVLDRLAATGVETAIVNVHYLADQIERHLAGAAGAAASSSPTNVPSCSIPAAASSRRCRSSAPRRSIISTPTPSGSTA